MPTPTTSYPRQLGDYEILELMQETEDTQTFAARQRTVDRTVALVLLKPHRCGDPEAVAAFREETRAKAAVSQPRIASVYESAEEDGQLFYTREVVAGQDLTELATAGEHVSLPQIWEFVRTTCDAYLYYESKALEARPLRPESLVLIHGEPYMANLATADPSQADVFAHSLAVLRDHLWPLISPNDAMLGDVQSFFARMDPEHPRVFQDWNDLLRACNVARKITSPSQTTQVILPPAKPSGLSSNGGIIAASIVLLLAAAFAWWAISGRQKNQPVENTFVTVSAGEFVFGEGETRSLASFAISKYEVTIGEYSQFLKSVGTDTAFDHADQPKSKRGHYPDEWPLILKAAQNRQEYHGYPLTLNCPIFGVDWWDAYAYARWSGGRLPTAEEWEKAARGAQGSRYAWGDDRAPEKANTGQDIATGGKVDGFTGWAPVNVIEDDVSAYGIVGTTGNVAEWTATWETDPSAPDRQVPIFKGASCFTKKPIDLVTRRFKSADHRSLGRGFRIAKDA